MSTTPAPSTSGTLLGAGLIAVLWMALGLQIWVVAPRSKRTFDEFGLALPTATQWVVTFCTHLSQLWWITVPGFLILAALTLGGLIWMRNQIPRMALIPMAVVILGLSLTNGLMALALFLPLVKLQEGLLK